MTEYKLVTNSPEETRRLGAKLAKILTPPFDVLLIGELGAGKTELVRGFLSCFGHRIVRSPSFTVVNSFKTQTFTIHHIDLFRIKTLEEIEIRGIFDILSENDSIRFIEWPEIIKESIKFQNSLIIKIQICGESQRIITAECTPKEVCENLFRDEAQ